MCIRVTDHRRSPHEAYGAIIRAVAATVCLFSSLTLAQIASAQQRMSLEPLTDFELSPHKTSLSRYVLQYETDHVQPVTSVKEFRKLVHQFTSLSQKSASSDHKLFELTKDRFSAALSLKYYLDRLGLSGLRTLPSQVQMSSTQVAELYRAVSRSLYKDAGTLLKKTPSKALYQYYRMSASPPTARSMAGLEKIITDKSAPPALKFRVYLYLLHFHALSDENIMDISKIKSIEKKYYTSVRGISLKAHVLADLTLASAYAGVKDGIKLRDQIHPQYMDFLKRVAAKLDRLPGSMRRQVVHEILLIWQLASGGRPQFLRPPLSVAQVSGTPYEAAFLERYALARFAHSHSSSATRAAELRARLRPLEIAYRRLMRQSSVAALHDEMMHRLLSQHELIYQQTKDYSSLEKQIMWQLTQIQNPRVKVDKTQMSAKLKSAYELLVNQEVHVAPSVSKERRLATVSLVDRYIKVIKPQSSEKMELYESQAQIYVMNKAYILAVRVFMKAYEMATSPLDKVRFVDLAIRYQSLIARWPSSPPWTTKPAGVHVAHLGSLASLYNQKQKLVMAHQTLSSSEPMSKDVAQLGLIYRFLGQDLKAADIFTAAILRAENISSLSSAAAYLAVMIYETHKKWQKLETLTEHLKQNRIPIRLGSSVIGVDEKLALALAYGGREHLIQKNYSVSVTKLTRFLQYYARHPFTSQVRLDLAQSLWGDRKFHRGLKQLEIITREHATFRGFKTALQLAIDWSMDLGDEQAILYFIKTYTVRYQDRRSFDLRLKAVNLYEHSESFRDSFDNIEKIKTSPFITPNLVVQMDLKLLDLLESSSSQEDMARITDSMIRNSKDPTVLSRAYEIQMNYALARRDKAQLARIESALSQLKSHSVDIKEVLAMTRLHQLVMSQPQFLDTRVQNISLDDPLKYLKEALNTYRKISQQYIGLCAMSSSACVAAMGYLQNITRRMRAHIDDVSINPEYDQKVQQEFVGFKSYVERLLKQNSLRAHQLASSVAQKQGGLPVMIQRMLWLEGKDWNFDPLSSGSGSGFVSWQMKDVDHDDNR